MTFSIPIFGCIRTAGSHLSIYLSIARLPSKFHTIVAHVCISIWLENIFHSVFSVRQNWNMHSPATRNNQTTGQPPNHPTTQNNPTSNNAVNCQSSAACRAFGLQFVKCLSRGFSFGRSASGHRICWLPDFPGIRALNFRQPTPCSYSLQTENPPIEWQ